MVGPPPGPIGAVRRRWTLPRRTVRLKLTLLYGGLILASGVGLTAFTYVLVAQHPAACATIRSDVTIAHTCVFSVVGGGIGSTRTVVRPGGVPPLGPRQLRALQTRIAAQAGQSRALVVRQDSAELQQFVVLSGIALAILALVSVAIGWFVSGRVLRPLRTITTTAREISATSLHRRLALPGPDDELKELGDTFDALLGRLEHTFDAQRQFVANASHELRTPLARQRTLVEVALEDPGATAQSLRATHERVLAAGAEQERLIEALLALARGQRGLDRHAPLDLEAIAGDIVATQQPEATRRGLSIATALGPARASGDPRLVERLVANLVDNAVRHNVAGGLVHVETGTSGGRALVRVANTGPIVPAAEVDRLGEPFRRAGQARTGGQDGLGLGLSIVSAIATAHGATLAVRSRPAGGLDVTVSFPSGTAAPPGPPAPAVSPPSP